MTTSSNSSARPSPVAPTAVADNGTIRTGMGFKPPRAPGLPPANPPAAVADSGTIRTGMGFKPPRGLPASMRVAG